MADWNKPVLTSNYSTELLQEIKALLEELCLADLSSATNLPNGAIQYSQGNSRWEIWDTVSWSALDPQAVRFPANTTMVFYQASAPTGWTKITTQNDKALRVVSGNGGGVGGVHNLSSPPSTAHTHTGPSHTHNMSNHTHTPPSHNHNMGNHTHTGGLHIHSTGGHVLTLSQIPSHNHGGGNHNHSYITANNNTAGGPINFRPADSFTCSRSLTTTLSGTIISTEGGNQAHDHGNTGSAGNSTTSGPSNNMTGTVSGGNTSAPSNNNTGASGTGSTSSNGPTAFKPKYIDVIICKKN